MKPKRVIWSILLFLVVLLIWPFVRPWTPEDYIVAMERSDSHDPKIRAVYVEHLIAMGPRAIPAVIAAIRNNGTRSRRSWQLNNALAGLGPAAKSQLIAAIDKETEPRKRMNLLYSLHKAFGDFSRINLWLQDVKGYSPVETESVRQELFKKYPEDIPSIFIGEDDDKRQINPLFVKWYRTKMVPRGTLPYWEPAQTKTKTLLQ